jgi:hypothetical protein
MHLFDWNQTAKLRLNSLKLALTWELVEGGLQLKYIDTLLFPQHNRINYASAV